MNRIDRLRKLMQQRQIEGFFSENPKDILYLLSFQCTKGLLWITADEGFIFLDDRYLHHPQPIIGVQRKLLDEKEITSIIQRQSAYGKVAFCGRKIAYDRVNTLFKTYFSHCFERWESIDLVENLRMVKDADEISRLKKAAELTKKGFQALTVQRAHQEKALARQLKASFLALGADGFAFEPIVAFDHHAASPHYTPSEESIIPHQEILIDAGALFQSYHGDMTRTILLPQATDRLKQLYQITEESYHFIVERLKVGMKFIEATQLINDFFARHGKKELFLHSLGHGIGLDLHEMPFFNHPLAKEWEIQENMVFTIEPGLYDPAVGGVRYENMIWMSDKGPVALTE